ncbi:hypothetical protein FHW83_003302 [Duganella sp. SG902]|uniref:hypothetical protein n=1 Tax=Duganella sp. SG902 TaxID=2587016 RepID=UPI00159E1FCB|nr:hypothetical protein [Duganella sp. SG902]NVM77484.1 hypothetical protein [Duganella sp. SG902]
MIQVDDDTRAALFGAGVLEIDENGKTVFRGLTAPETRFVLDFKEFDLWGDREKTQLFRELLAKFHTARDRSMQNVEKLTNERLMKLRTPPQTH